MEILFILSLSGGKYDSKKLNALPPEQKHFYLLVTSFMAKTSQPDLSCSWTPFYLLCN